MYTYTRMIRIFTIKTHPWLCLRDSCNNAHTWVMYNKVHYPLKAEWTSNYYYYCYYRKYPKKNNYPPYSSNAVLHSYNLNPHEVNRQFYELYTHALPL